MWHYIVLAIGWVLKTIYELTHNYGVAIILFTIIIKCILIPLNIHSQKAMRKQQKVQPILAEIQKKYANDQNRLQQETMKVYKENNISMTGGCLPLLIQMPILLALYQAIRRPLTYMFNVPYKDVPENIINQVNALKEAMLDKFPDVVGNLKDMDAAMLLNQSQIQLSDWAQRIYGEAHEWFINFKFLGMNLSNVPWTAFSYLTDFKNHLDVVLLLAIPVLAVIASIGQNKISMHMSGQDKQTGNEQAQSMNKMMVWMMPAMTAYFTLILPAGLGLYWIISSVVQIVQQIVLYYYFEKKGEDVVVTVPEDKRQQHRKKSKKRR
ncbi:MAG: YidC/Oxa1 family membrane protein insertase [Candidatus Ornithomonoglobus sp.]